MYTPVLETSCVFVHVAQPMDDTIRWMYSMKGRGYNVGPFSI